jgi:hypothetical protein
MAKDKRSEKHKQKPPRKAQKEKGVYTTEKGTPIIQGKPS